jgi:hypothetical protein
VSLLPQLEPSHDDNEVDIASQAPFIPDLLAAEAALWGGFWHFDVIGPGYRLPAVELALLRAVRLDRQWPAQTTVEAFLEDLRRAIRQPQAGRWGLTLAGVPCLLFAAPEPSGQITVVYYCRSSGCLHAGYRTGRIVPHLLPEAVQLRPLAAPFQATRPRPAAWLAQAAGTPANPADLALRLDKEILRLRRRFDVTG